MRKPLLSSFQHVTNQVDSCKPLVDICGKPMIQHVWERCCLAVGQEKVYVATDDVRIQSAVEAFGGQVVMTSSECLTGTDRLAEANLQLNCDFIVNVQGDEPLINPDDINMVIKAFLKSGNVTNAMCAITSEQEFRSFTVPKVTFSQSGKLLYMSRAGIPRLKWVNINLATSKCVSTLSQKSSWLFLQQQC